MLKRQLIVGTVMVLLSMLFHIVCIGGLVQMLSILGRSSDGFVHGLGLFTLAVFGITVIHGIEAWGWAMVYIRLGEFAELATAVYFSVVTTTTLGYGDLTLTPRWRVLASFQAIAGLILFGASTAFLFEVIRQVFSWEQN